MKFDGKSKEELYTARSWALSVQVDLPQGDHLQLIARVLLALLDERDEAKKK